MPPAPRLAALRARARAPRARLLSTTAPRLSDASEALPPKKPMGAFRGGLFGFLLGTALSGSAAYTYLAKEYRATNDLLLEDICTLQASVNLLTNHVKVLEQQQQRK